MLPARFCRPAGRGRDTHPFALHTLPPCSAALHVLRGVLRIDACTGMRDLMQSVSDALGEGVYTATAPEESGGGEVVVSAFVVADSMTPRFVAGTWGAVVRFWCALAGQAAICAGRGIDFARASDDLLRVLCTLHPPHKGCALVPSDTGLTHLLGGHVFLLPPPALVTHPVLDPALGTPAEQVLGSRGAAAVLLLAMVGLTGVTSGAGQRMHGMFSREEASRMLLVECRCMLDYLRDRTMPDVETAFASYEVLRGLGYDPSIDSGGNIVDKHRALHASRLCWFPVLAKAVTGACACLVKGVRPGVEDGPYVGLLHRVMVRLVERTRRERAIAGVPDAMPWINADFWWRPASVMILGARECAIRYLLQCNDPGSASEVLRCCNMEVEGRTVTPSTVLARGVSPSDLAADMPQLHRFPGNGAVIFFAYLGEDGDIDTLIVANSVTRILFRLFTCYNRMAADGRGPGHFRCRRWYRLMLETLRERLCVNMGELVSYALLHLFRRPGEPVMTCLPTPTVGAIGPAFRAYLGTLHHVVVGEAKKFQDDKARRRILFTLRTLWSAVVRGESLVLELDGGHTVCLESAVQVRRFIEQVVGTMRKMEVLQQVATGDGTEVSQTVLDGARDSGFWGNAAISQCLMDWLDVTLHQDLWNGCRGPAHVTTALVAHLLLMGNGYSTDETAPEVTGEVFFVCDRREENGPRHGSRIAALVGAMLDLEPISRLVR